MEDGLQSLYRLVYRSSPIDETLGWFGFTKLVSHDAISLATSHATLKIGLPLQTAGDMSQVAMSGCNLQWFQSLCNRCKE